MSMRHIILAALLLPAAVSFAQITQIQPSMAPPVLVTEQGDSWIVKGKMTTLVLNKSDLSMEIKRASTSWKTAPAAGNDLAIKTDSSLAVQSVLDAKEIEISPHKTGFSSGLKIVCKKFTVNNLPLDLTVLLFVDLETPADEVVFRIAVEEGDAVLRDCRWPKGFTQDSFDYTVLPFMQGVLLPKQWPQRVRLYDAHTFSRGLYMPWWGFQQGNAAAMLILETPDDAACDFKHPANGPTSVAPRWLHSLNSFRYARRLRMCFFDNGDYVDLAKRYRTYVQSTGHFVSLSEKIARTPNVAKLIGSPILHTSILSHVVEESSYFDKEHPEKNHRLRTFDQRLHDIQSLKKRGVDRLYVHVDGWGWRGYDNLHPEPLPPALEAGGWDGLRRLVDGCHDMGFLVALHDQYRDYYLDSISYQMQQALMRENGSRPYESTWAGGPQTVLCASFAPGFVAMNHGAFLQHDIRLDGSYLDVFAVVPPEECYHPEHVMSRSQCLTFRGQCLSRIKQLEGIVSSEEPADWAIPRLDLVHHGPYALQPNPGGGPAIGIPIPLFNLVYHDAILLPWSIGEEKGGWGIPDSDSGFLHALLNGGMPYISIAPDEAELSKVNQLCALGQRVALLEMVEHRFLNAAHRQQQTTFVDGTVVTVDFNSGAYSVRPELATK